jgi:hypothetical protein
MSTIRCPRNVLLAACLAAALPGCGPLLYPVGTFDWGCAGTAGADGSALSGVWSGPVNISTFDPTTAETTTAAGHITVSFDARGLPGGVGEPWPDEWPCFAADAHRTHIRNACPGDPFRYPPQQTVETLVLRDVACTATGTELVWVRWLDEALCPEGHRPTQYELRTYSLRVTGDELSWSLVMEQNDDWSWGTRLDNNVVTTMTGVLARVSPF